MLEFDYLLALGANERRGVVAIAELGTRLARLLLYELLAVYALRVHCHE